MPALLGETFYIGEGILGQAMALEKETVWQHIRISVNAEGKRCALFGA